MALPIEIETVLDTRATIGESPTWVAGEGALYWVDIKAPSLHRLELDTGIRRSWPVTSDLGGFALTGDGGALVALREGLFRLDLGTGALDRLAPPPFEPALFRFNEGACDPTGRFWIGVMFDPLQGRPDPRPGLLYSFTLEDGLRPEPDASELHNGMAWSADGRTFFLSHSYSRTIYAHPFDPSTGRLGPRRTFATITEGDGIPDGAAIDVDGGYWCALHGAARVRRYRKDGSKDFDVAMPVSQPTMCAFAGHERSRLYVTSAAENTNPVGETLAGALLSFDPQISGIARNPFVR